MRLTQTALLLVPAFYLAGGHDNASDYPRRG